MESTSYLCVVVITQVQAEYQVLKLLHSVHFVTVEDFTCKFLQIHNYLIGFVVFYLPLMMHSNAKFTFDESSALVSRIAIYSFSA